MDFISVYTQTIQRAFIEIVTAKGCKDTIDLMAASAYLKSESVRAYDEILAECKAALDCNMGEAMYRAILSTNCNLIAARAWRVGMGLELN